MDEEDGLRVDRVSVGGGSEGADGDNCGGDDDDDDNRNDDDEGAWGAHRQEATLSPVRQPSLRKQSASKELPANSNTAAPTRRVISDHNQNDAPFRRQKARTAAAPVRERLVVRHLRTRQPCSAELEATICISDDLCKRRFVFCAWRKGGGGGGCEAAHRDGVGDAASEGGERARGAMAAGKRG